MAKTRLSIALAGKFSTPPEPVTGPRQGLPCLSLLEGFADAVDGLQVVFHRGKNLLVYRFIGLAVKLSSLAVTENHEA